MVAGHSIIQKLPLLVYCMVVTIMALSCESLFPEATPEDQVLDGQVEGLSSDQRMQFSHGDAAFNNAIFNPMNGLGPIFVATSCGSCHPGDGKGHPFTTLIRFGQTDGTGNQYMAQGGPQLQNRAIPGFEVEEIPAGATFSKFTPPANTGLGFLDAVPDADLLATADPADANGDGISGVVNWISLPNYIIPSSDRINNNGKHIGRFGKKAGAFNLLHQTVNAFIQDMGITTTYHPDELIHGGSGTLLNDNIMDPELPQSTVDNVVFYLKTLKAPVQRKQNDADVLDGKNIFMQAGCESCHRSTLKTGFSPIASLSLQEFHPFTDLLMHDMGPGLDDGYTEGSATTSEWRTPPLWGLGLSRNSQGGQYYLLHDGRALSIEQAITQHGGEGKNSRDKYEALPASEKQKLINYLESL